MIVVVLMSNLMGKHVGQARDPTGRQRPIVFVAPLIDSYHL